MKYTCPMHPEVIFDKKGHCPQCGMNLVKQSEVKEEMHHSPDVTTSYTPLFVIIGIILLVTASLSTVDYIGGLFHWASTISYFMGGFFVVFAAFKLMDLKGFAQGYSTYDLLAMRWFSYGYIYPFIELFFGLTMIVLVPDPGVLFLELIIMTFSGIGVAVKLARHEKFQCACLGTFLKVPLTKVTLIEDFGMALLALIMLLLIRG